MIVVLSLLQFYVYIITWTLVCTNVMDHYLKRKKLSDTWSQIVLGSKEKSALVLRLEFWRELECMNSFTLSAGTLLFKAASVKVVLLYIKRC